MWAWLKKLLRKLLGYTDYDLEGKVFDKVYRRYGSDGLIDVRNYIRPGEVTDEIAGLDWLQIYRWHQSRLEYVRDPDRFGLKDFWLTPRAYEEGKRIGDCEDSDIWMGSAYEKNDITRCRIVLGCYGNYWKRKRHKNRINHAWLMVKVDGVWMVVETTSKTANPERADKAWKYVPRMSFNAEQVFVHNNPVRT